MMDAFCLDGGWPRGFMPLRSCFAIGQQSSLKLSYNLGILTVSGHNHAQMLRQRQRLIQFRIVDAECTLVRQKTFERGRSVGNDLSKLVRRFVVEARHTHMERVIASRLPGGF